jgi:hypothetical protein
MTPSNLELQLEIIKLWEAHQRLTSEYNDLVHALYTGRKIDYDTYMMPDVSPNLEGI